MKRPGRIAILVLALIVAHFGAAVVPEPCPITYDLWQRSLHWGSRGAWLRETQMMKDGLDACDAMTRR